jgi:hypothetical protein
MSDTFRLKIDECSHERLSRAEDTTVQDKYPRYEVWCGDCGEDQMALPAFLRARIEEDRDQARDRNHDPLRYGVDKVTDCTLSDRALREAHAKQLLVDEYVDLLMIPGEPFDDRTEQRVTVRYALMALAGVYAGHPEFQRHWEILEVQS